jgi:hypothetical protein
MRRRRDEIPLPHRHPADGERVLVRTYHSVVYVHAVWMAGRREAWLADGSMLWHRQISAWLPDPTAHPFYKRRET